MKERNIYQDGIKDVKSVNDLDDLLNGNFNILANQTDYVLFEFGNDFWKLDRSKKTLKQYNDYMSMKEDRGETVYNEYDQSQNIPYGTIIFTNLENCKKVEELPEFSLQERIDYVVEPGKNIRGSVRIPAKEVMQHQNQVKSKLDDITSNMEAQEVKPLFETMKATMQMGALNYLMYKKLKENKQKEKFLKNIVDGLDKGVLDINKILRDRELYQRLPEIEDVIKRYMQQNITDDELIKEVSKNLENNPVKEPPTEKELLRQEQFQAIEENIIDKINFHISDQQLGTMKHQMATEGLSASEYVRNLFLSNKEVAAMAGEAGETVQDYTFAAAYLAYQIDERGDENNVADKLDKRQLAMLIDELYLGKGEKSWEHFQPNEEALERVTNKIFAKHQQIKAEEQQVSELLAYSIKDEDLNIIKQDMAEKGINAFDYAKKMVINESNKAFWNNTGAGAECYSVSTLVLSNKLAGDSKNSQEPPIREFVKMGNFDKQQVFGILGEVIKNTVNNISQEMEEKLEENKGKGHKMGM